MTSLKKILVIGDVMLDKYWHSSTSSFPAEAPTAAVVVNQTEYRAGGAANVTLNIRMLARPEMQVSQLASLGQDADGHKLKSILDVHDIKTHWVISQTKPTITKHRVIADHQQLVRIDFEQKYDPIQLTDDVQQLIAEHDIIVISDYDKGTLDKVSAIIGYARSLDKFILVDPKGDDFSKYKNADLLTPNLKEFTHVVGETSESDMESKAVRLIQDLNLQNLLVTLGENGMTLYGRDHKLYHACSYADHVYDVTGAGDTVIASLAVSLAENKQMNDAIEHASHAAALVVSQLGTSSTTRQDVENQITTRALDHTTGQNHQKICHVTSVEQLSELVMDCQEIGIPVLTWDFVASNLITASALNSIINPIFNPVLNERRTIKKSFRVCLVVGGNVDYFNKNKDKILPHSIEELVYMLSLLAITTKVIYSTAIELTSALTSMAIEKATATMETTTD